MAQQRVRQTRGVTALTPVLAGQKARELAATDPQPGLVTELLFPTPGMSALGRNEGLLADCGRPSVDYPSEATGPERAGILYSPCPLWPETSAVNGPPSPSISGLGRSGGLGWLGRQGGQLDPERTHDLQNGVVPRFGTGG